MKKLLVTIFYIGIYRAGVRVVGCLQHPYQTVYDIVEKQTPIGFLFFPLLFCLIGWWVARTFAFVFLSIVPFVGFWWFLEVWWLTFWGMWQITLLYLYIRFHSALTQKL